MSAETPKRRKDTARALGLRFNRSPRTIRRVMAEPREEWLARAADRHSRARELHSTGMSFRKIAAELGCSAGSVQYAIRTAEKSEEL